MADDVAFDHLMSCVYDVRQRLVTQALQAASREELADELGEHWLSFTFDDIVQQGYAQAGDPAQLSKAGEDILLISAGIPPLPSVAAENSMKNLMSAVTALVNPQDFRVMQVVPSGPDPTVAIATQSWNKTEAVALRELAEVGVKLLAAGNFAVAFSPKQGWNEASLYVFSQPGKAPRVDITVDKAYNVLTGREAL